MSDEQSARSETPFGGDPRGLKLFVFGALTVAGVGFFVGVREPAPTVRGVLEPAAAEAAAGDAPASRTYKELMERPWDKNPQWRQELSALSASQRQAPSTPTSQDPVAYAQSMERRADRRAFEGAPPTIPHRIDQRDTQSCVSCHVQGVEIKGRVARPMSHPYMTNCVQCHASVEAVQPWDELRPDELKVESDFEGMKRAEAGGRALPGAPPLMPHSSWMRERCMSCHGPYGWPGIQTSHPERQSCMQCHGPASGLEQAPRSLP